MHATPGDQATWRPPDRPFVVPGSGSGSSAGSMTEANYKLLRMVPEEMVEYTSTNSKSVRRGNTSRRCREIDL